jgi:hypothetical protein
MTFSTKRTAFALLVAAGAAASSSGLAQAQSATRVEAGVLRCTVEGGVGLVLGSRKDMSCVFRRRGGPDEYYTGRVTKIGLDIGITRRTTIAWAVLAPSRQVPQASLAGRYGGVSAEASVGIGAGANALLGGSRRNVMLQPLSVQGQTGLNIAAGVAGLTLRPSAR